MTDSWFDALRKRLPSRRSAATDHFQRGASLLDEGKAELALAEFEAATKLDPDHIKAHAHKGAALRALHRNMTR